MLIMTTTAVNTNDDGGGDDDDNGGDDNDECGDDDDDECGEDVDGIPTETVTCRSHPGGDEGGGWPAAAGTCFQPSAIGKTACPLSDVVGGIGRLTAKERSRMCLGI